MRDAIKITDVIKILNLNEVGINRYFLAFDCVLKIIKDTMQQSVIILIPDMFTYNFTPEIGM